MNKTVAALLAALMACAIGAPAATAAKSSAAGTSKTTRPASAAETAFKKIYTAEWAWRQKQRMEDSEDDDSSSQARLPAIDVATQMARQHYWSNVIKQLDAIDPAALSQAVAVDYAVYRAQVAALLANQVYREYEKPLNADTAFWSNMAGAARRPYRSAQEYRTFISQMGDVPRYFGEEIVNMRAGLKRGFTPPKVTLIGRDSSITSVTDAATPQDTLFYLPFKNMPASIPAAEQETLRAAAVKVIGEAVVPAHKTLLKFMREEYAPNARDALAAYDLPDGKAYYQSKILEFTTTNMTPEQIHALGLSEMAKLRVEMQAVMEQTKFKGDLSAFLTFLRTDPQFYAKTPKELLMNAAYTAKKFDAQAALYFGHLPRQRFAILPVPDDQAPFFTGGRGGPGVYMVNTYNLPARPLYSLPALTLHESAPGHAFQMPVAMEQGEQPAFRKLYISAFGEGWALYCERLGSEMGIYETPYETFGMLSYQAWRVARLVVDTGIHTMGWTRAQAQQYLHDNTAQSDHEIETEVDRYISWPGQSLSYYLGQMAIMQARAKAEAALGAKFDIRAFHDTVLQLGSVPLPVLAARIDRFIAEGGKSPYPAAQ